MRNLDLTNQKFGKLTAVCKVNGGWECLCECGGTKIVTATHLAGGNIKSCGCLNSKVGKEWYDTALYRHWGRRRNGVGWPTEWYYFQGFKDWAVSSGYAEGLYLNRHNSLKPYSPENCYWATSADHSAHTTCFMDGRSVKQVASDEGISEWALRNNLKRGYSESEAIKKSRACRAPSNAIYEYKGERGTVNELASKFGCSRQWIHYSVTHPSRAARQYTLAGVTGTIKELCAHFGRSHSAVYYQIRKAQPIRATLFSVKEGESRLSELRAFLDANNYIYKFRKVTEKPEVNAT